VIAPDDKKSFTLLEKEKSILYSPPAIKNQNQDFYEIARN
jgi:hypothetical protein